ncbi:c-type cytochrome [Mucilaginibacter psychrotolerans]|uniref:Cytochrome c n=1 Tax=Mucilaginibacter psychrotolerans TaxID=1524096 RepID=A0A4Y8SGE2_9SPHI|nr:cytochrome c [Mucilaginibacter psychrotolerans]TFF37751.1 cytochrome c [Mucilaginibacter psychrotolerans]
MKEKLLCIALMVCTIMKANAANPDTLAGKTIFTSQCTSCHAIGRVVVGPALKDVDKRRSEQWIMAFVRGSQKVIKNGDTTAKNLFEKFNETVMPDHPGLTDDNIRDVVAYIKAESIKTETPVALSVTGPDENISYKNSSLLHQIIFIDGSGPGSDKPISFADYTTWIFIFCGIFFFIGTLCLVVRAKKLIADLNKKYDLKEQ